MSLEIELFQAILANPDDITPRLIYADWCDAQGDPRGEFIRIQCELAAYEGLPVKVRHLREREAELWKKHRRAWNGEIHRRLAATRLRNLVDSRRGLIRSWEYQRGFVESAVVEARAFLECPEALFQIGPLLHVRIFRVQDLLTQILHSPHLPRLKTLELLMPDESNALVERWIQLIRPERVAHVEIHPAGGLPPHKRPANERYPWRRSLSLSPASLGPGTIDSRRGENPGLISNVLTFVVAWLLMLSPLLCFGILVAAVYLIVWAFNLGDAFRL